MSKRAWIFTAGWALAALAPQALQACATCYGQSDSDLARGLNWGIFTLLLVVLFVLSTLVVFFVFLARRAAAYADLPASADALTTKQ
jgi:threonine/homoserine/homoserine lactone efflux protein